MAVPRNRLSTARKNSKRAHHAKTPKQKCVCKNCGALKISHAACSNCGMYAGKQVLNVSK